MSFRLSPGQAGDAPEGRKLLSETPLTAEAVAMDRAYEGDETRELVAKLGSSPEVPPKSNRRSLGSMTRKSTGFATRWSACSGS